MIGKDLGPYRIESELGSGGMGRVYEAIATSDEGEVAAGTRVALKVVHPHLLEHPGFQERFLREARIGRSIRHPNVVQTLDFGEVATNGERCSFIVLEYVEGETLRDLQRELDRVPEQLCRHIGQGTAKGLCAIHDAGIVHRDIKSDNVIVTPDGHAKILDFGLAKSFGDEPSESEDAEAEATVMKTLEATQQGLVVGTIGYMSPEQARGRSLDHRGDGNDEISFARNDASGHEFVS